MRLRRTSIALAGLTVGVVAASCGGSPTESDSTATPDSSSTSSTPTPSTTVDSSPSVAVTHIVRQVGSLKGAVHVVERDSTDQFVYVVSRTGRVERWGDDGSRIDRVLDVSALTTTGAERGLLGLAFRREANNEWFAYVSMTNRQGNSQIVRHTVDAEGDITERGTVILEVEQPYANHNGGDVHVGPDGMLYVGLGDGGSGGDPERHAKNLSSLLGKVLRIDPTASGYDIPADNPYVDTPGARPEIWSIGLRNPWRFAIDASGDMWIADVGQNDLEEVNLVRGSAQTVGGRAADFGWSAWEASRRYNSDVEAGSPVTPLVEYSHDEGRCSVSGGAVATGATNPGRDGWFFYGDYCSGEVWSVYSPSGGTPTVERVATDLGNITSVRSTSRAMWVTTLDGAVHVVSTTID